MFAFRFVFVCLVGCSFVRSWGHSSVCLFGCLFAYIIMHLLISLFLHACTVYIQIYIYIIIYTYIHHHYRITNHHKSLFHCHQAAQIPQQVPLKNQSKGTIPPTAPSIRRKLLKRPLFGSKKKTRAPLPSSSSSSSSCPYQGTSSLLFRRKPAWARRSCKSS